MEKTMITAGRSAIRKLFAVGLIGLALVQVPERVIFAGSDVVDDIQLTSGYEVVQEGTGPGRIGITGEAEAEYDFVFRITESGVLGEASFIYSPDGGKRWSETIRIPLSGFYVLGTSGLTAEFWLPEEEVFLAGDIYRCYVPDPFKLVRIKQDGNSSVAIEVHSNVEGKTTFEVLEQMESTIVVKIRKSGEIGEAVWQVSQDGGLTWSEETYATEELVISSEINGVLLGVTIAFQPVSKTEKFSFERGDVIRIYAEDAAKDNFMTVAVIFLLAVLIISFLVFFGNKKLKEAIPLESEYGLWEHG